MVDALADTQADAQPDPKPLTTVVMGEKEIISLAAETLKPPEGDIGIIYNFAPSNTLDLNRDQGSRLPLNLKMREYEKVASAYELMNKGYNAAMLGQYEAAVVLYKDALMVKPDDPTLLYSLGAVYQKLRQYSQAKDCYKQVLSINPTNKKALQNFLSAISEVSPEEAFKELKELEQVNPHYSPVLAQIGMLYAKKGEYNDAEKYLRKAIILAPNEILYKYNLAVMYDKSGNHKVASKLYQLVLDAGEKGVALPQISKSIKQRIEFLKSK
jgi:Flp pilus assembly protein TadD